LVDVFFRGYGQWYYNIAQDFMYDNNSLACTASNNYEASGVFTLIQKDEVAYKHTKSLSSINVLIPSNHVDCEFSRMLLLGKLHTKELDTRLSIEDTEDCYFCISQDQPFKLIIVDSGAEVTVQKTDKSNDLDLLNVAVPNILDKSHILETERNTLLKLIIGMAIDAYGYDPTATKNIATGGNRGSIQAGLDRCCLNADQKTIKKYLEAAAELYPDAKPRKP
jgi:hypothetical protein